MLQPGLIVMVMVVSCASDLQNNAFDGWNAPTADAATRPNKKIWYSLLATLENCRINDIHTHSCTVKLNMMKYSTVQEGDGTWGGDG